MVPETFDAHRSQTSNLQAAPCGAAFSRVYHANAFFDEIRYMNRQHDIRLQLKRALVDLEAARDRRTTVVAGADTRAIDLRVNTLSDAFTRLMEKLIAQMASEPAPAKRVLAR